MKRGPAGPPAGGWGPVGSQRGPSRVVGLPWPYLSRAPIRDSRVTRQAPTGPVVLNRRSNGNLTEPQLRPIWPDGPRRALTDDSMDPYRCTTKIRTHTGPRRAPTSPDGTQQNPILCQHLPGSDNVRHGTPEPDHPPSGSCPQG